MMTETKEWRGGEMTIALDGADFSQGGQAILVHRQITGDGHFVGERFERHKAFASAGNYKLIVPRGVIAFEMHAPADVLNWHSNIRAVVDGVPLFYPYELEQSETDQPSTAVERARIAREAARERQQGETQ